MRDIERRALAVVMLLSLALFGLGARLAHLQLRQHHEFSQVAMAQRFHEVRLDAPRGDVLDRQGRKLVTSRSAYRLHLLYPAYVREGAPNRALLGRLADLLGVDLPKLEEAAVAKLRDRRYFEPLLVKDDLTSQELTLLMELRATMPGLYIDVHPVRHYPHGTLAAHTLGHVGQVTDMEEARKLGAQFLPGDYVGRMGVEQRYDSVLQGKPGAMDLGVDALYRPTGEAVPRTAATPGHSLRLTLDLELQRKLEASLASTLTYVSTHPDWNGVYFPKANVGAAVVMDVRTGAILAMASYPSFDPNTPFPDETPGDLPFFHRAVNGSYMPGSTWKMLTAAAALEHGVVDPHEEINCTGVFDKIEPKKDWKLDGHGWVNVTEALAHSCNIYFYEMGYRLGVERLAEVAAEFGFGKPLGVDLPWESTGWIPDGPRRQADPDPASWDGGRLLSAAIGQGLDATPLQLARYTAILANGGTKVQPHVAAAVVDFAGNVVQDLTPAPEGRINLSAESFRFLRDGMEAVTDWGTSAGAFKGLPLKVAGKTGTAEVTGEAACAGDRFCQYGVYVAYAPADRPEIAVAVVGERAGHGDSMNPVVRAVMAHYFKADLPWADPLYTMSILPRPAGLMPPAVTPVQAPAPPPVMPAPPADDHGHEPRPEPAPPPTPEPAPTPPEPVPEPAPTPEPVTPPPAPEPPPPPTGGD